MVFIYQEFFFVARTSLNCISNLRTMNFTKTLLLILCLVLTGCREKGKTSSIQQNLVPREVMDKVTGEKKIIFDTIEMVVERPKEDSGLFTGILALLDSKEKLGIKTIADGTISFEYKLSKGAEFDFNVNNFSTGKRSLGENTDLTKMQEQKKYKVKVIKVLDRGYLLKFTLQEEIMKQEVNGKLVIDLSSTMKSTREELKNELRFLKANTGSSYEVEIDKKGKVLDVFGLDAYVAHVKKGLGDLYKPHLSGRIKAAINKEMLQQMFKNSMVTFPTKKLKVGGSWTVNKEEQQGPILQKRNVIYTVKELNENEIRIEVKGTVSQKGGENQEQQGMKKNQKVNIKGTLKGILVYDTKTGWLKKYKLVDTNKGYLKNEISFEGKSESQTILIETVNTLEIN